LPDSRSVKAWSQNLGHKHVLTTFTSYGNVAQLAVHVGFAFHVEVVIGAGKSNYAATAGAERQMKRQRGNGGEPIVLD
jgi:hypothetical protein